jgi:hypothetical protein
MSEWAPCSLCGHERENMCACVNPRCSDYVPLVATAPKAGDLVDRLRGKYTVQIDDGAGPLDGKTEMSRDFSAFIPPIHLEAAVEIETLRRWKAEQLTVTAWWQAIDDYIRKSPDAPLGVNVSAIALQWLQQRRGILETFEALEAVLGTWRTDLASVPDHLPFGSDSRDKIAAIIKQIEELLPPST